MSEYTATMLFSYLMVSGATGYCAGLTIKWVRQFSEKVSRD